jgi:hypothetical protein
MDHGVPMAVVRGLPEGAVPIVAGAVAADERHDRTTAVNAREAASVGGLFHLIPGVRCRLLAHIEHSRHCNILSAIKATTDKDRFRSAMLCPLMTQSGHTPRRIGAAKSRPLTVSQFDCGAFGKVGMVGTVKFEARIQELVENLPDLAVLVEPLLIVRRVLREQIGILHRRLLAIVRDDEVCRRLMTVPGVGPVVALTYRATVDVPARFRNSKAVGAVLGLTPSKYQSGEINRSGAISKCGDEMMRVMLYEAAQVMLTRTNKWSWLKAWAMKIARHRGMKKAIVALARRLAVIMHRIWVDGTEFQWTREAAVA